jgi:hypothetical protein
MFFIVPRVILLVLMVTTLCSLPTDTYKAVPLTRLSPQSYEVLAYGTWDTLLSSFVS